MNDLNKEKNEMVEEINAGFLIDTPKVFQEMISEGCVICNNPAHWGDMIIDKPFLDEMYKIGEECIMKESTHLILLLFDITNKIISYFFSDEKNKLSREETYVDNNVVNDEHMIIGTKMSSLKGKNIAECSEKSVAAYIIMKNLYDNKKISIKPKLILSRMGLDSNSLIKHAFVTLERKGDEFPKYFLWDVENPTAIIDSNGKESILGGIFALTDEENKNIEEGIQCSPTSIYETCGYQVIDEPRIYGIKAKKDGFGGQSNT